MNDHALILEGVTKRFGQVLAVDNISFRIQKGCICGFIGPNGAGKTTTIRMIMSIIYPDAGKITVLGQLNSETIKDRLGYLPEEKGLYKKMKAGEIIAYFGRLKGMPAWEAKERASELLKRYGLEEWIDKRCETLSKGMGQKVQLLGTLIHDPELVILDEPFSGLDPVNVEVMRNVILQMKEEQKTVIFSTHVMEQAEQICDYILMINKGKLVLNGTLAEVRSAGDKGILLDYDGNGAVLRSLPGITRVNDSGKQAELFMEEGADPQEILAALVGKIAIRRFDLREPSLHEIFIRTVGGQSHE
jgi:ABC-2 type transport system ATP-binding protein